MWALLFGIVALLLLLYLLYVMRLNRIESAMDKLWSEHVWYTREFLIASVAKVDTTDILERLMQNQEQIGSLYGQYMTKKDQTSLTKLLKEHIQIAGQLVADPTNKQLLDKWYVNAQGIADSFGAGTRELRVMMKHHLQLTLKEFTELQAQSPQNIQTFDLVLQQAYVMAEMFSKKLVFLKYWDF